eukprot:10498365-Heterocapsa_arctica.AAC.1
MVCSLKARTEAGSDVAGTMMESARAPGRRPGGVARLAEGLRLKAAHGLDDGAHDEAGGPG